jgi:peptide/nickel transport system permease protein
MDPLTWTGAAGTLLNPIFLTAAAVLGIAVVAQIVLSLVPSHTRTGPMTLAAARSPADYAALAVKWSFGLLVVTTLSYLVAGILQPAPGAKGITRRRRHALPAGLDRA